MSPAHLEISPRPVTVAATQFACSWDRDANIATAERLVREAAGRGAQVILLQELFETPYFCIEQDARHLALATTLADNPAVRHFVPLARALGVVLPVSFFERAGNAFFNSVAIIDADGRIAGVYRKSHIPNGPGYQEKNYFSPGDTGFRVWNTRFARIGVGICWDQWYPECARVMALMGAEVLFYPTAIGSEPYDADLDTSRMWRRAMLGHAVSNCMPVVAANRNGAEDGQNFYGHSFITDEWGDFLAEYGAQEQGVLVATLDLARAAKHRAGMGFFRDRRPQLYGRIAQDI